MIIYILAAVIAIYLCLLVYFYLIQNKLVFPGAYQKPNFLLYKNIESLSVSIASRAYLQGWCIQGADNTSNSIAIYFGGNGEDVANVLDVIKQVHVSKIYSFNYRGYALSKGKINEQGIYDDALAIFDEIKKENENKNIIVIGQSLGTAIAGYLAAKRDVFKLVLISPFTSIKKVANRVIPFMLFSFILRSTFNLEEYAKEIKCPVLVVGAENDTIIPLSISKEFYSALNGVKNLSIIPNLHHNNILLSKSTFNEINRFL